MIVSQEVGICICFKRSDIVSFLLKTNVVRKRRCNVVILEYFNCCWEGGEVERWERWESGELVRWQSGKGGRVVKWEGGRFLILSKGGERRVSQRFGDKLHHRSASGTVQFSVCVCEWYMDDEGNGGWDFSLVDAALGNCCLEWEENCFAKLQGGGYRFCVQKTETGLSMLAVR